MMRGPRIAIIDNRDSFAYNLKQYVGELARVEVKRYDEPPDADGYIFSPGPGRPEDFPVMYEILGECDAPVLGVCLGHQAVVDHFGGRVGYADEVVHGKRSLAEHDDVRRVEVHGHHVELTRQPPEIIGAIPD